MNIIRSEAEVEAERQRIKGIQGACQDLIKVLDEPQKQSKWSKVCNYFGNPLTAVGVAFMLMGSVGNLTISSLNVANEYFVNQLEPLVEQVDGQAGISLTDRLDFARRADLSEDEKSVISQPDYHFSLADFNYFTLVRALNSYRRGL